MVNQFMRKLPFSLLMLGFAGIGITILLGPAVCSIIAIAQPRVAPEVILLGGTVITLDGRDRIYQALAIAEGKILAVGSAAEIGRLASEQTSIVNLHGRSVLAGFYAAHDHLQQVGEYALFTADLASPPVGEVRNIAGILASLTEREKTTSAGAWIRGSNYDDTLLSEKRHPTRYELDQVSRDHPIWINHVSGHLGVANSRALEIAGITRDTPQPEGGRIHKDTRTGEPNGVFEESSLGLVTKYRPPLSDEQWIEAIRFAAQRYVARGVTTTVIAGGNLAGFRNLPVADQKDFLPLRVVLTSRQTLQGSSDRIRLGGVKLGQDGSIQGYTGYLSRPYFRPPGDDSTYRGYPAHTAEQLADIVQQVHREGRQILTHGNGDAAIDDILSAYRQALKQTPRPDSRHRIEHCQTVREDQLDAMKQLGVTPSFFVAHVYYWGDRHRDIFLGPERAARISPLASARRRGIRFTLHNDSPASPVNPLLLVWCAVNRLTYGGKVLGPEQRIPVIAALRAVTSDAAWQNFEENTKGSIEPGKLADLVVLDENPLSVPPTHLKDINISMTIVGGKTVYESHK